jgi:predicted TIM-barrel fold metal-dependent hydrolase
VKPTLTRRGLLQGACASALLPLGCGRKNPRSPAVQALLDRTLAPFADTGVVDAHMHMVGLGTGDTGCWVHPMMQDPIAHPLEWARFQIYQNAGGVSDLQRGDAQYVATLRHRIQQLPIRFHGLIFAFDWVYGADGKRDQARSMFHTPNDYVLRLAQTHRAFLPVASVHPYRPDAVAELYRVSEAGAIAIKWLPNAQRFDPASAKCDKYYATMQALGLTLITHAGDEMAVHSADTQRFGDPQRLRRALDAGVQVVVAHCASTGAFPDERSPNGGHTPAFDLFLRLMDTPDYAGLLFGEISAITLFNRAGTAIRRLLERSDLHPRLIHGSDYPLPAIDPLIQTWQLRSAGLIPPETRAPLAALFNENPLLFDLVLKRCLCLDGDPATGFPPSVFQGLKRWA